MKSEIESRKGKMHESKKLETFEAAEILAESSTDNHKKTRAESRVTICWN